MKKKGLFVLFVLCLLFICCKNDTTLETTPEAMPEKHAQEPCIISISEDVTTSLNKSIVISVEAEVSDNGTLSYQWYFANDKLSEGDIVEDACDSSFYPDVTESGSKYYFCKISNTIDSNTSSILSPRILVTVSSVVNAKEPFIAVQPIDEDVIIPSEHTFTVGAVSMDDGTINYQWFLIEDEEDAIGIEIPDATDASLKVSILSKNRTGYYCKITNTIPDNGDGGIKSTSIVSSIAWIRGIDFSEILTDLVVKKQPNMMNIAPFDTKQCTFEYEVEFESGYKLPISYQWYSSTDDNYENGEQVICVTSNTSSFTIPVFTEPGIRYYYCVARLDIPSYDGNDVRRIQKKSDVISVAYTGLPTLYITTQSPVVSKDDNIAGRFSLIASGIKNGYTNIDVDMEIKGRGNSSWSMSPKKSYNIKLSSKEKVLGMDKSKKWALIANYFDKTLLRNSYASYINHNVFLNSENKTSLGWNPSYVHVDVVMNGEYLGNYTLAERIQIDEKRVNIPDISKDIENGGFICEINERADELFNFRTTHGRSFTNKAGIAISLKDPDEVSDDAQHKIRDIVQTAEDSLFEEDFADTENGYTKYFDLESLIDWYIMHEFIRMEDATVFYTSAYFYYNPNDQKLHMGPCWDYDTGAGNTTENLPPEGFDLKNRATWYARLFEDANFVNLVQVRWNEVKTELINSLAEIQIMADELNVSADYNFIRWKVLGKQTGLNPDGFENRTTYQSELDFMTDWLNQRINWLDTNINSL